MITSTDFGGRMRLKRMLKPCANAIALPLRICGLMNSSYVAFCSVSGIVNMMTLAHFAAAAMSITVSPAASALAADLLPSRNPTTTGTPDSLRFNAWA